MLSVTRTTCVAKRTNSKNVEKFSINQTKQASFMKILALLHYNFK